MSVSLPLTAAAFWDIFPVADGIPYLEWSQESSESGGGDDLYADRGPARWVMEPVSIELPHAQASRLTALLNALGGGLNQVQLYPKTQPFPSYDPDGSIMGATTPTLGTISNRSLVAFAGFPAGYQMKAGEFFMIVWATSRVYLGQFLENVTANGSGAIAATSIVPALPQSIGTGAAVNVIKPYAKFRVTPNSVRPALSRALFQTLTFKAKQSYAA